MSRPRYEVADVFRLYGDDYFRKHSISAEQFKVFNLIKRCRTATMGGHLETCGHCAYQRPAYNSCRNRHCPKCQTLTKEKWLADRCAELLPTGYFHVVFTLPHLLNGLVLCNRKKLLALLFDTANEVLAAFAADPQWRLQGRIGFIAVLHTWSQTLMDHFHLHCLIPGGVLSPDERRWIAARRKFLFRNRSLAKAFRRRYLQKLHQLYDRGELALPGKAERFKDAVEFNRLIAEARAKDWIVYAKRPFAGPARVLEYLGRYTHRVAISNHRIIAIDNGKVAFSYRDRSDGNRKKTMKLEASEFIRRFLLHVLPDGFMKIRYFGFLSHRHKNRSIARIRCLMEPASPGLPKEKETTAEIVRRITGVDMGCCPRCGAQLRAVPLQDAADVAPEAPPDTS